MSDTPEILFVGIHNAERPQMAAALSTQSAGDGIDIPKDPNPQLGSDLPGMGRVAPYGAQVRHQFRAPEPLAKRRIRCCSWNERHRPHGPSSAPGAC